MTDGEGVGVNGTDIRMMHFACFVSSKYRELKKLPPKTIITGVIALKVASDRICKCVFPDPEGPNNHEVSLYLDDVEMR